MNVPVAKALESGGWPMIEVTAAIIVQNGTVLIAKRRADDALAGRWEFPGGKVEENETPRACLQREIREELGIHISVGEHLGDSVYHDAHDTIRLRVFRAKWTRGRLQINDHEEIRWVGVDRLRHYRFAPADVCFVNRLISGDIAIEATISCNAG